MDTPFTERTCEAFVAVLSSAAPVPGGGGAAALVGAVGTALGAMAGNLTAGRKKYAAVEEDIRAAVKRAEALQKRLPLSLIHMLGLYQTLCIVFYRITPQITLIHLLQKDV